MRYAIYGVEPAIYADSVTNAVGEAVCRFHEADHDSFPVVLVLVALKGDGSRDRRINPVAFRIDHDLRPVCFTRSMLGDLVRRVARHLGR